jgi:tRNA pseudouridine38-40 synthase
MEHTVTSRVWKLALSYDGTEFHGWQIQAGPLTVQGELRAAIARVTGEHVLPQGSGRTDAGVHALEQIASFALSAPIPEANFIRALNRTLPASIRVLSARIAEGDFHARHSAKAKTYEYRIFRGEICPPWVARYAYGLNKPLDLVAMQSAAREVLGEHDFTSFAASDPDREQRCQEPASSAGDAPADPRSNVRTIYDSQWIFSEGSAPAGSRPMGQAGFPAPTVELPDYDSDNVTFLTYRVKGSGFLHHMVRNLVGTFLEVGRGNSTVQDVSRILEARARSKAGPTAPARGLFLTKVDY